MFVAAFLDRVNVGYAKSALAANAGIGDAAYGLGAGIFFIGYAVFEIPSNLIMHRVGARVWMTRIMVSWGIIAAATALVNGPTVFYVVRTLLGIAEAGLFPGIILYLTYWYPNKYRGVATGLFYWGLPLAQIFGGPVSSWLVGYDRVLGMQGWRFMFVVEGLIASVVGVIAWFYLKERPRDAHWLPAGESAALEEWLESEAAQRQRENPLSIVQALRHPRIWFLGIIYFLINFTLYGVSFWLPSITGKLKGLSGFGTGLVAALPWVAAAIGLAVVPRLAARTGRNRQFAAACMAVAAIGLALSAGVGPGPSVAFLCVAAFGFIAVLPLFWNVPTGYLSGMAAAGGIALVNSIGNLGSFSAPYYLGLVKSHTGSIEAGLYTLAAGALVCAGLFLLLRRQPSGVTVAAETASTGG
jgi:sugar phosphate permease